MLKFDLKKGRIEKRLRESFLVVTSLMAAVSLVIVIALFVISNRYTYALRNYGFAQGDIGIALVEIAEARSATRAVIGYDDPDKVTGVLQQREENLALFDEAFAHVEEILTTAEERQLYDEISTLITQYKELDAQIVELGKTQDEEDSKEAQRMAYEELTPIYNSIYSSMRELLDVTIAEGDSLDNVLNVVGYVVIVLAIIVVIGVMSYALKLGKTIAKQIADSLQQLGIRLSDFAKGDLSSEFPKFDSEDEISYIANDVSSMAENLKVIIYDLEKELGAVASGNFTSESACAERYVGEFKALNDSLVRLRFEMKDVLTQMNDVAVQVDSGSVQLAESANALAEGATDQAASVQQLTATITDVTADNEKSAKKAEQAYQDGLTYEAESEKGKMEMDNLEQAMEQISMASQEIESIIGEIEDIASQTNLLALNASIEAARAGEAGKGFAVVAEQIGKLAADSAQSATRTRELIKNALNQTESGSEATERTKEAFEEIIKGINFLADVLRESSQNSLSQAATMREIQSNVEQISNVVQNNAAYAEETSATGEELAAQATCMNDLVHRFRLE